jgi:hypothetical protein
MDYKLKLTIWLIMLSVVTTAAVYVVTDFTTDGQLNWLSCVYGAVCTVVLINEMYQTWIKK